MRQIAGCICFLNSFIALRLQQNCDYRMCGFGNGFDEGMGIQLLREVYSK